MSVRCRVVPLPLAAHAPVAETPSTHLVEDSHRASGGFPAAAGPMRALPATHMGHWRMHGAPRRGTPPAAAVPAAASCGVQPLCARRVGHAAAVFCFFLTCCPPSCAVPCLSVPQSTAKTAVSEAAQKKYRKFSTSRKTNRRFQVWEIVEEKSWEVTHNLDIDTETQAAGFEALQKYIGENYENKPCAVVCKFKALEGADRRKTDKVGICVWIPDSCHPRVRFVTSQSQAALANLVAAKTWNASDLAEVSYEKAMEMVGSTGESKKLYSADPATAAADDDDDDE